MFEEFINELERIKQQIIEHYSPIKIILFGSLAKKQIKPTSDIDICIIANTSDKISFVNKLYAEIDTKFPIDIILYTEKEWEMLKDEETSFLHKILMEGEIIYGR